MPSTTSINTTSANSFDAIQCAAVAPTLPAPTMLTFFCMLLLCRALLEQRANVVFEAFFVAQAGVQDRDLSVAIDQQRHRQSFQVILSCNIVRTDHDGILH